LSLGGRGRRVATGAHGLEELRASVKDARETTGLLVLDVAINGKLELPRATG